MYRAFCPANRGAIVNPCAEDPWHQVQLRMLKLSPSTANEGAVEATIARTAIFDLTNLIISTFHFASLVLIAYIGRDRRDLRLGQIVRNQPH